LRGQVQVTPRHVGIERFEATAADTRLQVQGQLEAQDDDTARWRWQLNGRADRVDPAMWWSGFEGPAWQPGNSDLNLAFNSDGRLPLAALDDIAERWPQIVASLTADIAPSRLAGTSLGGRIQADARDGGTANVDADLKVGDNQLQLTASGRPSTGPAAALPLNGQADARVDATDWGALAPLADLAPGLQPWLPTAGTARLDLHLDSDGRQAAVRSTGQVQSLKAPEYTLADARWTVAGAPRVDAPLDVDLQATDIALGERRIDTLQARATGSLGQHDISLLLTSPLQPPEAIESVLGARRGNGTRLQLDASGRWTPAGRARRQDGALAELLPGRWEGTVRSLSGSPADATDEPWLATRDLSLQVAVDAQGRPTAIEAAPGAITVPGTALKWSEARWQAPPPSGRRATDTVDPGRFAFKGELAPLAVAPLLQRLQPDMGWGGDLTLGGSVDVRYDSRLDADIVFERQSGDLHLATDPLARRSATRPMDLSALRVGVSAHDGTWYFTEALAGASVGELAGVASITTDPSALYPQRTDPLEGVLQARVANLQVWNAWIPAGWDISGTLTTSVSLGGTVGEPKVQGQITGDNIAVINALEGVQWNQGRIDIALDNEAARIRTMELKAGSGTLSVSGEAQLSGEPGGTLKVTADHFQALQRIDRKVTVSGDADVGLSADALSVRGQVMVDEGDIDFSQGGAPTLSDDVSIVDPNAVEEEATESKSGRELDVNLTVDLGQKLRLHGRGLNTALKGSLKVTSPDGELQVRGRVRAVDGTYAAYGQRLVIERGNVIFNGPVNDPQLDILAIRPKLDIKVGVAVTGSALNPRIRLASEPEMTDSEKLSWLVLGRAPVALGEADSALLQQAALALLAGEDGGPGDSLLNDLGITDFSIFQRAGDDNLTETFLSIGKQLSDRWYLGYEQSVTTAKGTFQAIYRAAQRFTVRLQSGEENALDTIWTWRWD